MIVRSAGAADIPMLLPMVESMCALHRDWDPDKYSFRPDIVERYRTWLPQRAADPRSILLVAEEAGPGAIIGFLVGAVEQEIPIYTIREFGFIHDVWVEPAQRSRGVGRHLVDAAVARFAEMGVTQARLDTAAANEAARRLFASCGFRESTTEMLRVIGR